jgi:hypothetical protein
MALEDESLVGLRLLGSEEYSSTSAPRYTVPTLDTYQSSAGLRLLGSEEEEDQQYGNNARMRKRQIEREIQQQGSQEGPSMEAILIATLSFNSDEDGGDQVDKIVTTMIQSPKKNAYSLKRSSRVEVATGDDETPSGNIIQTTFVLSRLSNLFQKKNKKQQSRQTVRMEEGRSKSAIHMQHNSQEEEEEEEEEDEDTVIYTEESFNTVPVLDVMSARNSISAADRYSFMAMSASHRASQKSPRVDKTRHNKDQRNHTSSPNCTVKNFHSSPIARRLSSTRVPGLYAYQYQQREHNQEQIQQQQGSDEISPARKSK